MQANLLAGLRSHTDGGVLQAFGGALSAAPGMDTARFEQLAASPYLKVEETMMDLGPRVSRKKQFLPPVAELLESGCSGLACVS